MTNRNLMQLYLDLAQDDIARAKFESHRFPISDECVYSCYSSAKKALSALAICDGKECKENNNISTLMKRLSFVGSLPTDIQSNVTKLNAKRFVHTYDSEVQFSYDDVAEYIRYAEEILRHAQVLCDSICRKKEQKKQDGPEL